MANSSSWFDGYVGFFESKYMQLIVSGRLLLINKYDINVVFYIVFVGLSFIFLFTLKQCR